MILKLKFSFIKWITNTALYFSARKSVFCLPYKIIAKVNGFLSNERQKRRNEKKNGEINHDREKRETYNSIPKKEMNSVQ